MAQFGMSREEAIEDPILHGGIDQRWRYLF
jgi:hypothetical protein